MPTAWRLVLFAGFIGALVAWMVAGPAGGPRLDYEVGEIVRSEIVAPMHLTVVDEERTEKLREEAAARAHEVFDYNPEAGRRSTEELRAALESAGLRPIDPLVRDMARALDRAMSSYIITDEEPAVPRLSIRNMSTGDTYVLPFRDVTRLSDARGALRPGLLSSLSLSPSERERFATVLSDLVVPNVTPNLQLTEAARLAARRSVPEVRNEYRAGEIVAYRHQTVDSQLARTLDVLREARGGPGDLARWAGAFVFILVLLYAFWRFAEHNMRTGLSQPRAFVLAALAILMQIALARLGLEVAMRFGGASGGLSALAAQYQFAIPYAVASLSVALLVDGSLALVVGLGSSLLVGYMASAQAGGGIPMAIFAAITSAAAVQSATRYQARQAVSFAAAFLIAASIGGVGVVTMLAGLVGADARVHLTNLSAAIVGALLTAAVAALVLPIFEWGFDLLTDVRLLELANADRPILRELAIRAPGTHQHSYLVSTIATEAAKAINANPLLVRIGAYYHDIGKLHAPHMFIENQMGRPNPHDRIKPRESARYIVRHVTWGVRKAKEEGLPPQIAELITGHHGTRILHFFYEKAKREAKPGQVVDPDDFRYPGPKPQTKESAILMLADAAEAAVRSLENPERDQVEAIIRKITDAVVADGQFDECGMTLAEVSKVREALTDALVSLYHRRIRYPGFNPPAGTADSGETKGSVHQAVGAGGATDAAD